MIEMLSETEGLPFAGRIPILLPVLDALLLTRDDLRNDDDLISSSTRKFKGSII